MTWHDLGDRDFQYPNRVLYAVSVYFILLFVCLQQVNIFAPAEFQSRLDRLRSYMVENDIGACVLTSYHNITYFTGFLFCYFGRNYACVVTPETVNTISAGIDGGQPWRRGYGDNVVYTDWEKTNFYKGVAESVGEVNGRVALEFDTVNLENFPKYRELFPNKEIVDIGKPTMFMRMKKSVAEIEVIRHGARIADIGGYAVVEALEEGRFRLIYFFKKN